MMVSLKRLHPDAIVPTFASSDAVCFDLYSIESALLIYGHPIFGTIEVGTGWAVDVPPGYCLEIYSVTANRTFRLAVGVDIIDPTHTAEVRVKLTAEPNPMYGMGVDLTHAVTSLPKGSMIARGIIRRVQRVWFAEKTNL